MDKPKIEKPKELTYTKTAFLHDKSYNPDLINALLKDDKEYSKSEVEKLISKFLKEG